MAHRDALPLRAESEFAELLVATQAQEPADVIQRVHENAGVQYRITKRRKQQELSYKIAAAQRTGDRITLKNEKKKVDNHASAVASRVKQEFLVSSFETLVANKMRDSFRLVELVKRQESASAKKDAEMRLMRGRISHLMREVSTLNAHLSMGHTIRSSPDVCVRDSSGWLSSDEFSLDSNLDGSCSPPPRSLDQFDDLSNHVISPLHDNGHDADCVIRNEGESALTTFLETVSTQVHEVGPDTYKLEPTPWEPLQSSVITERQVSVRARLKPDEHDDSFNPVA